MARVRMSEAGTVELPQAVRDAYGLKPGAEFEVIDGGREIRLLPLTSSEASEVPTTKSAFHAFLAKIPHYDGPPVTDEMMHEAISQAAIEDWKRLERQWSGEDDDDEND